jgi:predicted secreted hydrolase
MVLYLPQDRILERFSLPSSDRVSFLSWRRVNTYVITYFVFFFIPNTTMSSETIPPPLAHDAHWPPPGTGIQKMSEIDLPRSSISEWWYFNVHLSLVDGRKASAFIGFIRTNGNLEQTTGVEGHLSHSHFLNFAISIPTADSSQNFLSASSGLPPDGRYHFTSAMDTEGAASLLRELEAENQMDPLMQRSLLEILRNNKLPEPDSFIPGNVPVSEEGNLDLKYGDLASVVCRRNSQGEDVYHIVAQAADGSYGFEFNITPRKPPVNYGFQTDLLTGIPDDQMCYYFVPRCDVTGSLRVDNSEVKVIPNGSMGFYERKFGGGIRRLFQRGTKKIQRSWKWASVQLSNGWDLTIHTLWDVDVYNGEATVRDSRAIAIPPEGIHFECDEHSFEPVEIWTSVTTLNDYGTKWKLVVPQLNLNVSMEAAVVKQEIRTIAAGRGYWEGEWP